MSRVRKSCRKSAFGDRLRGLSNAVELERMRAEVRQADRQVKSGHYIKHQDMKAWLLSWSTAHEMAAPKCVCGCNW